jgi:hypothetical protein
MSKYQELVKELVALNKRANAIETQLAAERKHLRALVKVNDKFKTFTEFEFNGNKYRAKYSNHYGDCRVWKNGVEIDMSLPACGMIRPSTNDLRLAIATGRI